MLKKNLPDISVLKRDFPEINFKSDEEFYWSNQENTIFYRPESLVDEEGVFRLLHEIGHAINNHSSFTSGIELLKLEVEAWEKAKQIASNYNLVINNGFIENCLDSYRDWLHLRSTCPNCKNIAVEAEVNQYHCFNCFSKWKVPKHQKARHYRMKLQSARNID